MTEADQQAILNRLQLHLDILRKYESGVPTEEDLASIILVCNSANSIINELQAGIDTERLIERIRSKA